MCETVFAQQMDYKDKLKKHVTWPYLVKLLPSGLSGFVLQAKKLLKLINIEKFALSFKIADNYFFVLCNKCTKLTFEKWLLIESI